MSFGIPPTKRVPIHAAALLAHLPRRTVYRIPYFGMNRAELVEVRFVPSLDPSRRPMFYVDGIAVQQIHSFLDHSFSV